MNYNFEILEPQHIKNYVKDFKSIEEGIFYPLENGEGNFFINHGNNYYPFFTQQGNKTRFVAIKNESNIIGTAVGVWKKIIFNGSQYTGLYIADLKIKPEHRKKGILKKIMWDLIIRWPFIKDYQGWDFCFFCTMLKNNQGVEKSFKGLTPAKLAKPTGLINIYMIEPKKLASLKLTDIPKTSFIDSINLSPKRKELVLWNNGKKDIVSSINHTVFNFGHLHPEIILSENSSNIEKAISIIIKNDGTACFAIDNRQTKLIDWLKSKGISTNTKCKIFSFSPFAPSIKKFDNIFISTGEI